MGTTCRVAPAATYSSAIGEAAGSTMWHDQPSAARVLTIPARQRPEPPRSATGWTERTRFVRVAVNVEQLLYRAPGGTGRYTAKLVSLLSDAGSDLTVIPFTARHRAEETDEAYRSFGLSSRVPPPVRLALPRPLLYDAWHSVGGPPLDWLSRDRRLRDLDLIHAPSLAVPPKGKARLVVNAHDAGPILSPESSTHRGRRFHRQGLR